MKKTKTLSILFLIWIFAGLIIPPVRASEDDLAIRENDTYEWQITEVDEDEYPLYKEGDKMTINIDAIEYCDDEDFWSVHVLMKNPTLEDDDPFTGGPMIIYEDGKFQSYISAFIPNEDIDDYLEDYADINSNAEADDNELEISSGDSKTTIEFNDQGIAAKITAEKDDDIVLEQVLISGTISFGASFVFVIPISVIAIIYMYYKKHGVIFNET